MKIVFVLVAVLLFATVAAATETVTYLSASALVTTGKGSIKGLIAYDNGSVDCTLQPYDNPAAAAAGKTLPAAVCKSGNGMSGHTLKTPYYRGLYITVVGAGCTGYVVWDDGQ